MSEWRPIGMAPEDGTYVLLWDADVGHHDIGRWVPGLKIWLNGNWTFVDDAGLYGEDLVSDTIYAPTQWMPLPHPPTDGK